MKRQAWLLENCDPAEVPNAANRLRVGLQHRAVTDQMVA
jgi:hypothetical protein